MPMRLIGSSLGLLCILATGGGALAGRNHPQPADPPAPKQTKIPGPDLREVLAAVEAKLQDRERRIDAELAAMDRPSLADDDWAKEWAGSYYTGDGLGMNVTIKIAPKAGITYTWHGCMGLYDANHGDIVETFDGGVIVRLAIDTKISYFSFMSTKLYFVKWGERRYLVPEAQMLELVNNYNAGGYARKDLYSIPLRFHGQVQRHAAAEPPGRPKLPPEYAKLIIENPLRLKISKVTEHPKREVTRRVDVIDCDVEIEGGRDQGVFIGMEILFDRGRTFGKIRIDRVDAATCAGSLSLYEGRGEEPVLPRPGMELNFPGAKPDEEPKPPDAPEKPH